MKVYTKRYWVSLIASYQTFFLLLASRLIYRSIERNNNPVLVEEDKAKVRFLDQLE